MEEFDGQIIDEKNINQLKIQNEQMQASQQSYLLEESERNLIKEQLDLTEELERIEHLLRGHIQVTDEKTGEKVWIEPKDKDDVLLTEAGVLLIMGSIRWYLNKNTLLSNYDEETINKKMEDFSTSLADALFMNYEKYFLYPTEEECQQKLIQKLKKRQQERIYSAELQGIEIDKDEVWKEVVKEVDPSNERRKIKEQLVKNKLKNFDLLMREVQDSVHSTYLRAWKGQERGTLRQHIHISEMRNPNQALMKKEKTGLSFFKRR